MNCVSIFTVLDGDPFCRFIVALTRPLTKDITKKSLLFPPVAPLPMNISNALATLDKQDVRVETIYSYLIKLPSLKS